MTTPESPASIPRAHRRRPTLTITAGPLSSGKSTWVRSIRTKSKQPLCLIRDEVRAEVGGADYLNGPVDHETEEAVTRRIREQTTEALTRGSDVFLDGCNNHPLTRSRWEALATDNSANFRVMLFNLSLVEIALLNAQRENPHPRAKIESSFRLWEAQFKKLTCRPQNHFINNDRSVA